MREVLGILAFVIFIIAIAWIVQGNDFFMAKIFMPQYEQVRNDTFHNSQMYNDGMKTDLAKYKYEYTTTTDQNKKDAICSVVRHDFASYPKNRLDSDNLAFVTNCENN